MINPYELADGSLYDATFKTIVALCKSNELDERDSATARLALELAWRIDSDGLDVGVSTFTNLSFMLRELRHDQPAQQASADALLTTTTV